MNLVHAVSDNSQREIRVAYLTAGAGGMFCGSCLRDNTLVAALRRHNRDVRLFPLYTPIRTDEADMSESCVLFGGINVYMLHRFAWYAYLPRAIRSLLDHPSLIRRAVARSEQRGLDPAENGPLAVSILLGDDGPQRHEIRRLVDLIGQMQPDVVHLPNAMFVGAAAAIRRDLGAKVICTLTGEDIFLDALPQPHRSEADQLIRTHARHVDAFIAPTNYFGMLMADRFALAADQVHHISMGLQLSDIDVGHERPHADSPRIGYLARICREKGLHQLIDTYLELRRRDIDCKMSIAGYLPPGEKAFLDEQCRRIAESGYEADVEFCGELSREGKLRFLRSIDLLSVPTEYAEAKGLYILEALAHAVPVVQPRHGSFSELIEQTGGGLLYEPGNTAQHADLLERLIRNQELRTALGCDGRRAVFQSFSDDTMARRIWALFEQLVVQ